MANAALLVVFVFVNGALAKLRLDSPHATDGFTAPLTVGRVSITALAGVVTSVASLVFYVSSVV